MLEATETIPTVVGWLSRHGPERRHSVRRPVRLRDVAELAGVSIATASTVLSEVPGARIAATTRVRVREAAREIGYVPRRRRATSAVAVMVEPSLDGFASSVLSGIVGAATQREQLVVLLPGSRYRAPYQVESVISGVIRVEGAASGDREPAAPSVEWRTVLVSARTTTPTGSPSLVVVRPDTDLEVDAFASTGASSVGCWACGAPGGDFAADCPHAVSVRLGATAVELVLDDERWERASGLEGR